MAFFIFQVSRGGELSLLRSFPDAPLAEAETYRRASAHLRELRRAADPKGGLYVQLVYAASEAEAREKLRRLSGGG